MRDARVTDDALASRGGRPGRATFTNADALGRLRARCAPPLRGMASMPARPHRGEQGASPETNEGGEDAKTGRPFGNRTFRGHAGADARLADRADAAPSAVLARRGASGPAQFAATKVGEQRQEEAEGRNKSLIPSAG